jgi:ADP-dependent NAD(P)H-hydrate dehydratase / NAD(P)H-hydrate epimerase
MKVVTAHQMQALDRIAIEKFHIPGTVLMENAGLRTIEAMSGFFDLSIPRKIVILAGKGNNGGDGFVIARHLFNAGHDVLIYLLADPASLQGDALTNFTIVTAMGIPLKSITSIEESSAVEIGFDGAEILVDAIFGTGLASAPKSYFARLIEAMNRVAIPVVAVDIPSGLHPDTGIPFEPCVEAELTVTYGLPKLGQILYPGADFCGELVVGDISFPAEIIQDDSLAISLLDDARILRPLISRNRDSHKGSYGHLFALAGSVGKTGAACLLAQSALRMGTGLVTVGIPSSLNDILEVKLTEVMTEPLPETQERSFSSDGLSKIIDLCERMTALAVGPGITQHPESRKLVKDLIREIDLPMIIDADGLNVLSGEVGLLSTRKNSHTILTPHPGEMARLLEITTAEVQSNRIDSALLLAKRTGCVVVLKGARTVIATSEGKVDIVMSGNPGMATGGSGDVLTGMIGALLAQGYLSPDAARMGTLLHGLAGDHAAEKIGEVSLAAIDIIDALSPVLQSLSPPEEEHQ